MKSSSFREQTHELDHHFGITEWNRPDTPLTGRPHGRQTAEFERLPQKDSERQKNNMEHCHTFTSDPPTNDKLDQHGQPMAWRRMMKDLSRVMNLKQCFLCFSFSFELSSSLAMIRVAFNMKTDFCTPLVHDGFQLTVSGRPKLETMQ